MREYVGCKSAAEISKVKNPANKATAHLVAKSDTTNPTPTPEKTDMDEAAIQKAATAIAEKMFLMSDVSKAHYVSLDEAGRTAFLAKSVEDQTKEATTVKSEAERVVAEAEAAKSGKSVKEAALEKSVDDLKAELAEIKKATAERLADADVEKAAADPKFAGYPGGTAAVAVILKGARALPEDARKAQEDAIVAHAALAKATTSYIGNRPSEEEIQKRAPATARIEKAAKELAAEAKIPYGDAYVRIIEKREYAADVAAANGE